jgi:hypothetical protein
MPSRRGDDLRRVRVELAHRKSLDTQCQTRAEQRGWPTVPLPPRLFGVNRAVRRHFSTKN